MALVYHGRAGDALLDTYDAERLPVIHQLVSTTERATDLFNSDSHFVHSLLRHMLPMVLNIEAVRKKGAGLVSELAVHYRKSPLNAGSEGNGTVHAGDRFPDVAVSNSGSERVLDVLDPSHFTALVAGSAVVDGDLCVTRQVPVPSAALRAALGDAQVAVVRPDGYLLCAGSAAFVQGRLDAWAARWLNGRERASAHP